MARKFAVFILTKAGTRKTFSLTANSKEEAWQEAESLLGTLPIDIKDLGNEFDQIDQAKYSTPNIEQKLVMEKKEGNMAKKKTTKKKATKKKASKKKAKK